MFYIVALLSITLLPVFIGYRDDAQPMVNVVPFRIFSDFFNLMQNENASIYIKLFWMNFLGNVLLFVPFGFFLGILYPKLQGWKKTMLIALVFSLSIEFAQLMLVMSRLASSRSSDIDDVIMNCLGSALGLLLLQGISRYKTGRNIICLLSDNEYYFKKHE